MYIPVQPSPSLARFTRIGADPFSIDETSVAGRKVSAVRYLKIGFALIGYALGGFGYG